MFTRYIDKFIRQNGFESNQKKDIEVQLDILLFYIDTDEEKQEELEKQEEG